MQNPSALAPLSGQRNAGRVAVREGRDGIKDGIKDAPSRCPRAGVLLQSILCGAAKAGLQTAIRCGAARRLPREVSTSSRARSPSPVCGQRVQRTYSWTARPPSPPARKYPGNLAARAGGKEGTVCVRCAQVCLPSAGNLAARSGPKQPASILTRAKERRTEWSRGTASRSAECPSKVLAQL